MSNTVICLENEVQRNLYGVNLEIYVGTTVVFKNTLNDLVNYLLVVNNVDIVVCSERMKENDKAATELLSRTTELENMPRFIILGKVDDPAFKDRVHCLDPSPRYEDLVKCCAHYLGVTAKQMADLVIGEFYPLSMRYLKMVNKPGCEIFLSGEAEGYTKILDINSEVTKETIKQVEKFGSGKFFVPSKERIKFVNSCTKELSNILENKSANTGEKIQAVDSTMLVLTDSLASFGVDEQSVKLGQRAVENLAEITGTHEKVGLLLKELLSNQSSFQYMHSQLITHLAFNVLKYMKWATPAHRDQLSMVAYFHDITLREEQMSMILSDEQLKNSPLDSKSKNIIMKHAQTAAELIARFPNAPMGVDVVIRQHHGTSGGLGFPKHFKNIISPLAMLFIVCEDYAHEIIHCYRDRDKTFDKFEELQRLRKKYTFSKYRPFIDALERIKIGIGKEEDELA